MKTKVNTRKKTRRYAGPSNAQAKKTEQPRGERRSHQNAKTNGSSGSATREAQTPGQPSGDSAKTEGRGANAKAKPARKEAEKRKNTREKQKNTLVKRRHLAPCVP